MDIFLLTVSIILVGSPVKVLTVWLVSPYITTALVLNMQ